MPVYPFDSYLAVMAHQHNEGFDQSFSNFVVIDGIPADVPASKLPKLQGALEKVIKKESGVVVKDIEIPLSAKGATQGCV